ncbi:MAG: molybdenum cofactor guanylyltransferase [Bacteroidales bacterium]
MATRRFSNATAIVLAGGKSSRMGGVDKSMLDINGMPMIQYISQRLQEIFGEVIIGANDTEKYAFLGLRVVQDVETGKGPLMGIYSCLLASSNDINFITACDIPEVNEDFIATMLDMAAGADIVMPVRGGERYEPLYAVYRKGVAEKAEILLEDGRLKISGLFGMVNTVFIGFDDSEWYHNLNFREDYQRYTGTS